MANWSEVSKQDLSITFRLDAEYYQPFYLENSRFLRESSQYSVVPLGALLLSISGGATPLGAEYQEDGIPFLRVQNIMPGYLDLSDVVYISNTVHETELKRSQLKPGDVLLTITGVSYGKSTYVPKDLGTANINQHSVRMAFNDQVLPEYVAMFLNSKYGKLQTDMKITGVTRPALDYEEIKSILIPLIPLEKQERIRDLVKRSEAERKNAKRYYENAHQLLLTELGIKKLDLAHKIAFEADSKYAFESERLDAEFFQPKFNNAIEAIESLRPSKICALGELTQVVTNGQTPYYHNLTVGDIPFITAEFVDDFRVRYDTDKRVLIEHHEGELRRSILRNGDLLITIKGRIGNAAVVANLPTNCNINQDVALVRLREDVDPYYIAAFLNSEVGKALVEQVCTGQINPFLGLGNLQKIKIPIFSTQFTNRIGDKVKRQVQAAGNAEQEAKNLLEQAKYHIEKIILGED